MNTLAITGSRAFPREDLVRAYVRLAHSHDPHLVLVTDGTAGPATWAADEAGRLGLRVVTPPKQEGRGGEWRRFGEVLGKARAVCVFWDNASDGALLKASRAHDAGKLWKVFGPDGVENPTAGRSEIPF